MFGKILVANRGEIACRIIRTARRMGIATVAVFSEADRDAVHVEMADEAVCIGPAPAAQSYLDAGKILAAARETGAEAVHPGYGFLSERAAFAAMLEEAGIAFIGPGPDAIRAMGDKIDSKRFAQNAGVSTVPGFLGVVRDAAHAGEIAAEIGFPVMIKASAGGGGKGMRIAWNGSEVAEGFARARSEARSSFGDDRLFLEKFVENPRHIEIQVLADAHGNCVFLGERECSIQRRNQKVVEEAPSPFLDTGTRAAMGAQAVALAKAVGYRSAGTVEFIVDAERRFFFLEMNTRLQVEHPVTELVTGLDLVEQMIRIAAGEKLALTQDAVTLNGWAVEARVYAEDPFRGFLPSIGRLSRYRPPAEQQGTGAVVRNDTGVTEGSEISVFYDPMIAKLCTWAPTRAEAVDAMAGALDRFAIDGIEHNIPFLAALMRHPRWREGRLSTGFIAEEFPAGFARREPDEDEAAVLLAVAASSEWVRQRRLAGGAAKRVPPGRELVVQLAGRRTPVERLDLRSAIPFDALLRIGNRPPVSVRTEWRPGDLFWIGRVGDVPATVQIRPAGREVRLSWRDLLVASRTLAPHVDALDRLMPVRRAPDTSRLLLCPMPGLVVSLAVAAGQQVKAGEALAVVEAMKMENVLRADRDLVVDEVLVKQGDSLAVDAPIMRFA